MAQHDYVIANGTGAAVRSDLNNALAAIVSQNSGATAPATTYAYQFWADTTTGTLKLRNSANSAWIELLQLDGTLTMEDGTEALPGLSFRSDLDTGLWRPGTNQLAISTNAVERVEFGASEVVFNDGGANYDFRVEGDTNANLLFVDASADAVGIGTSSPANVLELAGNNSAGNGIGNVQGILRVNNNTTAFGSSPTAGIVFATKYRTSPDIPLDGAAIYGGKENASDANKSFFLAFATRAESGNNGNEAMRIDSQGRVGIGSTAPQEILEVRKDSAGASVVGALLTNASSNANTAIGISFSPNTGGTTRSASIYGVNETASQNATALTFLTNANGASGTEKARLTSSGQLLVGTSSARDNYFNTSGLGGLLQVEGANSQAQRVVSNTYGSASLAGPIVVLAKHRSNSIGGNTVVQSGDYCGELSFQGSDGTEFVELANIAGVVDGTPGSNDMPGRLVFSTTADGASSPTERLRIGNTGILTSIATYNNTVSNAANAHFGSDGVFYRSTSSAKYKTNIQTLEDQYADAVLNVRPVWYQSTTGNDNPSWGWWGFIAEEVAEIDPRLVHWKTSEVTHDESGSIVVTPCEPEPEGVQYDRFVPHLLNLIKRQGEAIADLQAEVAALKAS